jgi:hypothetical protein
MIPPIYPGVRNPVKQQETLVMKGKSKSRSSPTFAKGGSGSMVGRQYAGPQKPGTTATDASGSGGDWAKGGSGHMVGKQEARPAKPA